MFGSKEKAVDGECPCLPVDGTIMEIGGESKHALCNINRNQSDASKRSVVREKKRKKIVPLVHWLGKTVEDKVGEQICQ